MQRKTHVVSQERCTTVELQTVWCNILPQLSIKLQVALVDRGRNQAIIVSPFWSLAWEHCSAATCCCKGVTNSIENAFLLPVPSLFATTNWTNQCWIGNLTYSLFILGEVWCTDAWAKLLVTCTYSHCFVVGWAVCEWVSSGRKVMWRSKFLFPWINKIRNLFFLYEYERLLIGRKPLVCD